MAQEIEEMFETDNKENIIEKNVGRMMNDIKEMRKNQPKLSVEDMLINEGDLIVDSGVNFPNMEFIGNQSIDR